ncbi:hypothetical protein [Acinetobacter piscicola]|uniref:hypothetical protein n=1 Tax=Acinetobacter piscicola TaxID=2006115 RepID=UPI00102007D5|nr:hypothetical protein [Acinetobacter piscicola]RYL22100.1 hypothetical protein EWP19_17185 [Acinetobacter piscicola]
MATDVDVQYFSHLNGLVLGNNWGDLIRLLDKALVTGIDFTEITALSIDDQGDVHITLYSAHNAMLFQVVELSSFTPNDFNQKYRIKGVPSATELVLKPSAIITNSVVTIKGTAKLASLGYEIIFRDTGDVKRVYRAKNPRAEHPFIRVDETITDGTNSYTSTYAKSAMVGLLENMTHIDDYENPEVLQLPMDTTDIKKNWKITGTGDNVVRGWSKWYWATSSNLTDWMYDKNTPTTINRNFTLIGDKDAFYLQNNLASNTQQKVIRGCGVFNNADSNSLNWFLATTLNNRAASSNYMLTDSNFIGGTPFYSNTNPSKLLTVSVDLLVKNHTYLNPIVPNYFSGRDSIAPKSDVSALEIPTYDDAGFTRGSFKHICFAMKSQSFGSTTPIISEGSLYIADSANFQQLTSFVYYYLGELE